MRFRYFGGLLAAAGVAGAVQAQTPRQTFSFLNENKPAARIGQVRSIQTPLAGEGIQPAGYQAPAPAAKPAQLPAAGSAPANLPATPASQTLTQGCSVGCPTCPTAACCEPCGPAGRFWVSGEYLYWTTSGNPIPPLVTTAPNGNPRTNAGNLGDRGTNILFGGQRANNDWRSGFRITTGMWLDECQKLGIESDFFMLGQSRDQGSFNSNTGRTIVSRPFFNALTGRQDTQLVKFPNVLYGTVAVDSKSDFWGTSGNLIYNICCDPCGRTDLLLGGRYMNLTDDLTIREDLTSQPGATGVPAGTRFQILDRFRTENNIYAATLGFNHERRFSHYFVGVRSTVGLGWNNQSTEISGSTTITPPGGPSTTYSGGLLTQPSNIGRYTSTRFVVIPEVGLKVGCQVTEHARAWVGYNFLYVSDVVRSGDAVDLRVNTNQIPPRNLPQTGPAVPAYTSNRTDFWAQGLSVGLEFRF